VKSLDEQLSEFFAACPSAFLEAGNDADRCVASTFFLTGIASMAAECYLTLMREGMPNLAQEFKGMMAGAISEAQRYGRLAVSHHNTEVSDERRPEADEGPRAAEHDPAAG
jgi:hypothetical protein